MIVGSSSRSVSAAIYKVVAEKLALKAYIAPVALAKDRAADDADNRLVYITATYTNTGGGE
jgi:hypothetical protein